MVNPIEKSYLEWEPAIPLTEIFKDVLYLSQVQVAQESIYWVEMRSSEKGRFVLMQATSDGEIIEPLPPQYNVRTRVHEYGGVSYLVHQNTVWFVNFKDQRIYRKSLQIDEPPIPITPENNRDGSKGMYAAFTITPDSKKLYFVYEKAYRDKENQNFIACLDLTSEEEQEPEIIRQGRDFYGDPVLSPNGSFLAWLEWDHPNMPWNATELYIANLKHNEVQKETITKVLGNGKQAICLPKFSPDNSLYFVFDEAGYLEENPKNWWNIYQYKNHEIIPVTQDHAEYGIPMWQLGMSQYTFLDEHTLLAVAFKNGKETLQKINLTDSFTLSLLPKYSSFSFLQPLDSHSVAMITSSPQHLPRLIAFDTNLEQERTLRHSSSINIDPETISLPQFIKYPTSTNDYSYGYFYPPKNKNYFPPSHEKPPLIVMVHGGPTSRAKTTLNLQKQFWTSQGYAIFDVDHHGSTGYGRRYRDSLLGQWGVIDANDIREGVIYLQRQGMVSEQVIIRGGSAGGYAVQRALTLFPELFKAGASYYGIGNLVTLAKLTHKFESKYLDSLIGCSYIENEDLYKERSPLTHIHNLKAPLILFQGLDDRIVTPEVSQEIVKILDSKGIPYEYVEYEGEGHGFVKKETNIDALARESLFYRKILVSSR